MNEQQLKTIFKNSYSNITCSAEQKQNIIEVVNTVPPASYWSLWLEKELVISTRSVKLVAVSAFTVCLLFIGALLTPGNAPEPQYKLLEIQVAHSAPNYEDTTSLITNKITEVS